MANNIRKNKTGLAIALLLLLGLVLLGFGHIFSFYNIGSAAAAPSVYINTYLYPSLAQQPATVNYQFTSSYGSTSGSCQTQIEYFNPDETLLELDAPIGSNYPISQKYASPSQQGVDIALCIITLPVQQTSTTTGTLYLTVSANGYSNQVSAQLTMPSQYEINQGNPGYSLIITIPLGSTTTTTTTATTTSTTIPSTTSSASTTSAPTTSTVAPTSATTIPPSTQQPPISQSNFFSNISSAIQSFINSIIQAFAKWFSI